MTAPSVPRSASILLVHDDGALLDVLTRAFEAREFEVAIAATEFAATTHLQGPRLIGAVVAGWSVGAGMGEAVYRWSLTHRYDLRARFVFMAETPPPRFDDLVQGRSLLVRTHEIEEVVRIAAALAENAVQESDAGPDALAIDWGPGGKPTLLLVEDDPLQLSWMKTLLGEMGFQITSVESHRAALTRLAERDYELILSDWYMADGSGADLYGWLTRNRPHLVSRCVFISASLPGQDFPRLAPGRPVLPKGQDAGTMVKHLRSIVEEGRRAS